MLANPKRTPKRNPESDRIPLGFDLAIRSLSSRLNSGAEQKGHVGERYLRCSTCRKTHVERQLRPRIWPQASLIGGSPPLGERESSWQIKQVRSLILLGLGNVQLAMSWSISSVRSSDEDGMSEGLALLSSSDKLRMICCK